MKHRLKELQKLIDDLDYPEISFREADNLEQRGVLSAELVLASLMADSKPHRAKRKIVIFADSHGRNMSSFLKTGFNDSFAVLGDVHPGATAEAVLHQMKVGRDVEKLTKTDFIVFMAGSNDCDGANLSSSPNGYFDVSGRTIDVCRHTNVIISTIPYRYDLQESKIVNKRIKIVNQFIRSLVQLSPVAFLLEIFLLYRSLYTRHGLHTNNHGKILLCNILIDIMRHAGDGVTHVKVLKDDR